MFAKTALERLSKADQAEVARAGRTYHGNYYDLIRHKLRFIKKRSMQPLANYRTIDLFTVFHVFEHHILQRSIVDRFEKNSPRRMAAALSISARFGGLCHLVSGFGASNIWGFGEVYVVLRALACRDLDAANKFIDRFPRPSRRELSHAGPLCYGIYAVLRQDMTLLRELVPKMRARKANRFVRGMYDCILGVLEDAPSTVASAIAKMLEFNRRTDSQSWMEKLVCVAAHGFYFPSSRVSPDLVSEFDTTRDLPWDAEYHAFLQHNAAPSYAEVVDFTRINDVLGRWVAELSSDMDVNELLASIESKQ